MKVAYIVTRADSFGGAQAHVLDLVLALKNAGGQPVVLAGGDGPFTAELRRKQIPAVQIRNLVRPIHPVKDSLALVEILAALRKLRPDLVCAHTAKAGLLGRLAGATLGVPTIFTPHGWAIADRISSRQGRLFRYVERLVGRFTTRIINVCEYERDLARRCRIAGDERLAMIYNGMPDVAPSLRADAGSDPPRLVTVARLEHPKDPVTILYALAGLKSLAWRFALIGEGPLEPLVRKLIDQLGLSGRVELLGFRRDVSELIAASQVFVLSSRSEAFPYSILEAMRAGLPVVATDVGGVREAVIPEETGLLSPAGDRFALQLMLRRVIEDPGLRNRMGAAGRLRFLSHFTFEKMQADTFALYREVLAMTGRVDAAHAANGRIQSAKATSQAGFGG
jgi:glycosyltransferase involved in cell wall biosynthesis